MDQKYIVALELSGSRISGALASIGVNQNGTLNTPTIEAIVSENADGCVQYGRVQNVVNAAKITNKVLQGLQKDPALNGGKINGVYVALAGRSLGSEKVSAEITLPSEMVISKEILMKLYQEAAKMAAPNRQVLKVLPRKYVVDNQPMPSPVGALGHRLHGNFTLVTCNQANQRNIELMANNKDLVDLPIRGFEPAPLDVAEMVLDEEPKQRGCALVDVGYETVTISIYKDRALQYLATLPMGSHNITNDISIGLNWTLEKAEKQKCTDGDALNPDTGRQNDEVSSMNQYVAARTYEIVANIKANIGYAGYQPADLPEGIILVGRGARLRNFDRLLNSQTKMKVRDAKVPNSINFGFSSRSLIAEDYISLIALVAHKARKNDFESCVTLPAAKAPERKIGPETQSQTTTSQVNKHTGIPSSEKTSFTETSTRPQPRVVQDPEDWNLDDPDPNDPKTQKTPKKAEPKKPERERTSRAGIITKLKEKWNNIVQTDSLDGDTQL